jgi:hypothetical protein
MIRARGDSKTGRPLIVLGLDAESLRLLKEGVPITVDGESPADLVAMLEKAGVLSPEGLAALKGQLPS